MAPQFRFQVAPSCRLTDSQPDSDNGLRHTRPRGRGRSCRPHRPDAHRSNCRRRCRKESKAGTSVRRSVLAVAFLLMGGLSAQAQDAAACRFLCAPDFKVEPTITFTTLFNSPRIILDGGAPVRERRETDFEIILSLGLP